MPPASGRGGALSDDVIRLSVCLSVPSLSTTTVHVGLRVLCNTNRIIGNPILEVELMVSAVVWPLDLTQTLEQRRHNVMHRQSYEYRLHPIVKTTFMLVSK